MTEDLPRTIENPINGEQVNILKTAGETGGAFVKVRVELPPSSECPVMHYHLSSTPFMIWVLEKVRRP